MSDNKNNFWTSAQFEPKRVFRFKMVLNIAGTDIGSYLVKDVQRPTFSIGETTHQYLNHKFYYPGHVTWNEVKVTVVDSIDPGSTGALRDYLRNSGYGWMTENGAGREMVTISKARAVKQGGSIIRIEQLDADGHPLEVWKLQNAWIKSVDFSEFKYEEEVLAHIGITFRFDWAELRSEIISTEPPPDAPVEEEK